MNPELTRARLTQARQILTQISSELETDNFEEARKHAGYLLPIFTQIGESDLVEKTNTLLRFIGKDKFTAQIMRNEISKLVDAKLSEATPHLRIVGEIKCPHCGTNIPKDSKVCSQCGKVLSQ